MRPRYWLAVIVRAKPCPCCGRNPFREGDVFVVEEYWPGFYWTVPRQTKLHKWSIEYRLFRLEDVEEAVRLARRLVGMEEGA